MSDLRIERDADDDGEWSLKYPFTLSELRLTNFRCFASLSATFNDQVTLVIGKNASGKTALLDAAAVAIGAWFGGTTEAVAAGRMLSREDARLVRQDGAGLPSLNAQFSVFVTAVAKVRARKTSWQRSLRSARGRTTYGRAAKIRASAARVEKRAKFDEKNELPLFAYYGTGRLWVHKRKSPTKKLGSRMGGYDGCMDIASNTRHFERWMAWREADKLQRIAAAVEYGAELSTVKSPHLDAVTRAITSCLEGAKRVFFSANHKELRIEFENGELLPFDRLSDGQRNIVAMVADIAWRAVQLNPIHGLHAPKRTGGVVLIDEIELHLHPAWQRRVIGDLTRIFPNIQFIITTHSPQVISSAKAEWIRVMGVDEDGAKTVHRVDHVHGRDSNALLRDIMGVPERPQWMEDELGKLERLIEAGKFAAARAMVTDIRGDVGESDETLNALEWDLQDREAP